MLNYQCNYISLKSHIFKFCFCHYDAISKENTELNTAKIWCVVKLVVAILQAAMSAQLLGYICSQYTIVSSDLIGWSVIINSDLIGQSILCVLQMLPHSIISVESLSVQSFIFCRC